MSLESYKNPEGKKVSLITHRGHYLVSDGETLKSNHHPTGGEDHIFRIKHIEEDLVELRTHDGKLVSIDGKSVYLVDAHKEFDTKFHLEFYEGKIAFKVLHHDLYLGVHLFESTVHAHKVLPSPGKLGSHSASRRSRLLPPRPERCASRSSHRAYATPTPTRSAERIPRDSSP